MSNEKTKPTQLTHDTKIDIDILAAALRKVMDPVETARLQRLQDIEGKPQVRIKAVSPTGSRFTLVIEEGRNYKTGELEQVIKSLEDYEYPWSPELEHCAGNYSPPLKFWKNPEPGASAYDWGTNVGPGGIRSRKPLNQVVNETTGQLNRDAKQKLYDDTWKADLRVYVGMNVAQSAVTGLREVKKAG